MKRLVAFLVLGAFASAGHAEVVDFDEGIDGDLDWSTEVSTAFSSGNMEIFQPGIGTNTISGSTSVTYCTWPCDNTDNDYFAINLGPYLQIDSAIVSYTRRGSPIEAFWRYSPSTDPDWSASCSNSCPGFKMGDGSSIDLSTIALPLTGSTIFSLNGHNGDPFSDGYIDYTFSFVVSAITQPVTIDIKPGKEDNSINLSSRQKIPVAILTTQEFDALQVDPETVRFGPDEATETHGRGHTADVDSDGDIDHLFHFAADETGIVCGQTIANLFGETFGGYPISGTDSIAVLGECVGYSLDLQASRFVLGSEGQTTIRATLRDASGNLVPSALIELEIDDPTGGSLSATSAMTDDNGRIELTYTAGTSAEEPAIVKITAQLASYPVVSDSVELTVGGSQVFISLSSGGLIEPSPTVYQKGWGVRVTDLEGVGVAGLAVDVYVQSLEYIKGQYIADLTEFRWVATETVRCFDEDTKFCTASQEINDDPRCRNGLLESGEDNPLVINPTGPQQLGGIGNRSGYMEAGRTVGLSSSQLVTDERGRASFYSYHQQMHGNWVKVRLGVKTTVSGTEYFKSIDYVLPVTASDLNLAMNPPGGIASPWGTGTSCQDTY